MTLASASRVTRSRRSLQLALLLFVAVLSAGGVLRAQEGGTPPSKPTVSDSSPSDSEAAPQSEAVQAPPAAEPAPARPRAPAASGDSPAHFEPTEKVRADFDVSFPIDI